jgi:hypothetical protein
MSQQQLLLKEKLSISQSLLAHGKQFTQITGRYSECVYALGILYLNTYYLNRY